MRFGLILVFYIVVSHLAFAQSKYAVEGKFRNLSAQGFAVYGSEAFLLNDQGWCRCYNLKKSEIISDFPLGSFGEKNHANCASFGIEKYQGNTRPVLFVSECTRPFRCFVENLRDSTSELIQTISLNRKQSGIEGVAHNWIVDRKGKSLYTIGRLLYSKDTIMWTCIHRITRYRLPKIKEGKDVILTDKDVLDCFDVFFPNLLQGATIKGKYLYLPTGRNQSQCKMEDAERALIVVDLETHQIERIIDLTNITNNEPEDCDFYKGKLLLYCGQSGGLYEIPYK